MKPVRSVIEKKKTRQQAATHRNRTNTQALWLAARFTCSCVSVVWVFLFKVCFGICVLFTRQKQARGLRLRLLRVANGQRGDDDDDDEKDAWGAGADRVCCNLQLVQYVSVCREKGVRLVLALYCMDVSILHYVGGGGHFVVFFGPYTNPYWVWVGSSLLWSLLLLSGSAVCSAAEAESAAGCWTGWWNGGTLFFYFLSFCFCVAASGAAGCRAGWWLGWSR